MYGWEPEGTRASTWGHWSAEGTFTPYWTEEMARNWAAQYREKAHPPLADEEDEDISEE